MTRPPGLIVATAVLAPLGAQPGAGGSTPDKERARTFDLAWLQQYVKYNQYAFIWRYQAWPFRHGLTPPAGISVDQQSAAATWLKLSTSCLLAGRRPERGRLFTPPGWRHSHCRRRPPTAALFGP